MLEKGMLPRSRCLVKSVFLSHLPDRHLDNEQHSIVWICVCVCGLCRGIHVSM